MRRGTSANKFKEGGGVGDGRGDRGNRGERERVVDCTAESGGGGEDEPGEARKMEDTHGCTMVRCRVGLNVVGAGGLILSV